MGTKFLVEKIYEGNAIEVYEETCQLFSEKLSEEFLKDNDIGYFLIFFIAELRGSKEFEKLIRFQRIIKVNQPTIYQDFFMFLDESLIEYYCFLGEKEKTVDVFSMFLGNPDEDIDVYLINFNIIVYYQNTEIIEQAILQNYEIIRDSENAIGNPEWLLGSCKYYLELEKMYRADDSFFDKKSFSEIIKPFDYNYDEIALSSIEEVLFKHQKSTEEWIKFFQKDQRKVILIIKNLFLKYMLKKGVHFYLSHLIYFNVIALLTNDYKDSKRKNHKDFFDVNFEQFQAYVEKVLNSLISEKDTEVVGLIWGSVYLYDMLRNIELISVETFDSFLEINRKMKGMFIAERTSELWNSNFVHSWKKPDCISESEFVNEESIFKKSLSFHKSDFNDFQNLIAEELEKIGELATYIRIGEKSLKKELNPFNNENLSAIFKLMEEFEDEEELLDYDEFEDFDDDDDIEDIWDDDFKDYDEYDDFESVDPDETLKPIRREPKIGRNEPCPCGSGKKYKKCCGKIV